MGREGGSKDRGAVAVINERLIRQGIQIEQVGPAEDDRTTRGASFLDKQDRADSRRAAAQQLELHLVRCLVLSYQNIGRIDNLVGVDAITKLHLDNNRITKIENLGHLRSLTWLDLSFNQISVIEGLSELTQLQDLSLYSNDISVVQGLDTLTNLTCLSLGKNKIADLEGTATYLHRFEKLRMLTLQGNRIEQQAHYKSRIIAFSRRIKFLDNRLVTQTEIDKASEEQRENFMPQEEEDARRKEESTAAKQRADEDAEYRHANCPNPTERGLFTEISTLEAEGRASIRLLLEVDAVKDKVKETVDTYRDEFLARAKELADRMKELRAERDADVRDFNLTLKIAKQRANDECKRLLRAFEVSLKRVIPLGLRATPDYDAVGPDDFDALRRQLDGLRAELLEIEADQWDGFEAVIAKFEDDMANQKVTAQEQLQKSFEELREVEKTFQQELKRKLDALSDDRQRAQQDSGDVFGGGGGLEGLSSTQKTLLQLLDNKDEYQKLLTEWSDLHIKRLDETEELHKKREDRLVQQLHEEIARAEHERNRSRISEIHAYVHRMRDFIEAHAQQRDGM